MLIVLLLLSSLVALSGGGAAKRQQPGCPLVRCKPPPCDNPWPHYYFHEPAGTFCKGCDYCLFGGGKKRLAVGLSLPFNMCPLRSCANPGFCSVPLAMNYFTFQGKQCPGCPFCPAGNSQISLS
ncbi:hypothetical protein V1264_022588 [Littorina saxatilis]|uniref:Uncharacterized protein n=1 Tax=Littorina saxatilis TaxID=31220 RepID=A0AAN9FXZ7_9CAEN